MDADNSMTIMDAETADLDPDQQLNTAIKISRQFMVLLEDYRYLLSCYQETCGCHMNFDNQIFFRKLEEKHNLLSNISANNTFLSNALDDTNEFDTLNDLFVGMKTDTTKPENVYIRRVRLRHRPIVKLTNTTSDANVVDHNDDQASDHEIGGDTTVEVVSSDLKSEKLAFRCTHAKCEFISFNQADIMKHFSNHDDIGTSQKFDKTDVLYVCEQCGKEFTGQKWLDNHIENVHAYAKYYSCDFPDCGYKSKFRCVMDDHRKRHGRNKEFKCTWKDCQSDFVTKRDMLAHINFSHKGVKNYACSWKNCTASFKDSNRLRHHRFTHTGERPYHCDSPGCNASFKQVPHLYKHRKTHTWEDSQRAESKQNDQDDLAV